MKRHSSPRRSFIHSCGTTLCYALGLFAYGAMAMPPVTASAAVSFSPIMQALTMAAGALPAAATSSGGSTGTTGTPVPVDQTPLTVQPAIPPNIVLMLDDSGSMNADYMPDNPVYASNEAMINASNNLVYYNPLTTYTPPPNADGTSYTSQTNITSVPPNGINNALPSAITAPYGSVDLTNYDGKYECDHNQHCGLKADGSLNGELHSVQFSASVPSTTAATYSSIAASGSDCQAVYDSTPGAFGVITFNNGGAQDVSGNCTFKYYPVNHYFQYSTGPASAPVVHYVASTNKGGNDCGDLNTTTTPTCVLDTTAGDGTNGAPVGITVGQNIANWFAYYHTRILMAKSGIMTAFSDLDPNFRVGFGSINGNNAALISSKFPNPYSFPTDTQPNNFIAGVAPFGKPTDATGQRFNFWSWIKSESAWDNTPLRQALDAVGHYYCGSDCKATDSKAWDWMSSDPGYSTRGDAGNIACRQAYTILTTDGFWNRTAPSDIPAGTTDKDGPVFTVKDASGNTLNLGYKAVPPFSGGKAASGPSLADVATYYWENDLQTGLSDEVPRNDADPAVWQHMVTFTMGLGFTTPPGITGTGPAPNNDSPPTTQDIFNWANDGGGADSKFAITGFGWPTPASNSINNIADLAHAGVNGHGGFFSATSPQSFVAGIKAALKRASERLATGSSLGANSTKAVTSTVLYQAQYFSGSWMGDLLAIGLDPTAGNPWSGTAAEILNGMATVNGSDRTYPNRDIMTYNTATHQFVAFANDTSGQPDLASDQLANLGSDAADVVNYLRGDNTNEKSNQGSFRDRTTPLGDIVDSAPVYVGAPDATQFNGETFPGLAYVLDSNGQSYSPFYCFASGCTVNGTTVTGATARAGMIYVAGNDGMLHAFEASDGKEVFAYLPGALLVNDTDPVTGLEEPLANLADPAYGSAGMPHQDYNDGQLTVADAYFAEGTNAAAWHTILVGTTGKGPARSVYAIDVTDPTNIKPLWERYAGDSSTLDSNSGYIGQITGQPVIAQTSSGTWSVLIGNGYNSPKGVAALLQFDLATGKLDVHATNTATSNGLAPVYTWMSNSTNGVSDLAYAGDLNGNVWQFNLDKTTCTGNGANQTCTTSATPSSPGTIIFTAKDGSGNLQPITSSVVVAEDPTDSGLWLFFGTGNFLTQSDISNTDVQTWYGLIVTPGSGNAVPTDLTGRSVLAQRSIIYEDAGLNGGFPARAVTPMSDSPDICNASTSSGGGSSSCKHGWYMDLVSPVNNTAGVTPPPSTLAQGERMVVPNQLQGGLLVGTTIIPRPPNQTFNPCEPMGAGWIMAIDPFTGTNPPKDFFDRDKNGTVGAGDGVTIGGKTVAVAGIGMGALPNAPIFVGGHAYISLSTGEVVKVATGGGGGFYQRVSWRELVNP